MKKKLSVLLLIYLILTVYAVAYAGDTMEAELDIDRNIIITMPDKGVNAAVVIWVTREDEDLWFNMYSKQEANEIGEVKAYIPEINFGDTLTVRVSGGYDGSFTLKYDEKLVFEEFYEKFRVCNETRAIDMLTEYAAYMPESTYLSELNKLSGERLNSFLSEILNDSFSSFSELAGKIDSAAAKAFNYTAPQSNTSRPETGSVISGSGGGGGGGGSTAGGAAGGMNGTLDGSTEISTDNTSRKVTVEELPPGENAAPVFGDLATVPWAEDSINILVRLGVVSGVGENRFEPDRNVTRAEFVKMVYSVFDSCEEIAECDLIDITESDWFYPYAVNAYNVGLVHGNDKNEFMPNAEITRQDAVSIIYRAIKIYKRSIDTKKDYPIFNDMDEVSEYAREAVKELYVRGVINGISETEFAPKSGCTRAMAAKMIAEVIEY